MDMMARPKVFVALEQARFDYSDAERFGDLQFVTATDYSPHQSSINNERLITSIRHCAENFNPLKDYLLLTGGPITMGLVFHAFANKAIKVKVAGVRCLQWNREHNAYRQVIARL